MIFVVEYLTKPPQCIEANGLVSMLHISINGDLNSTLMILNFFNPSYPKEALHVIYIALLGGATTEENSIDF